MVLFYLYELSKNRHRSREYKGGCQEVRGRRDGELLINRYKKFSYARWISSRGLLYNIVPMVNYTVYAVYFHIY